MSGAKDSVEAATDSLRAGDGATRTPDGRNRARDDGGQDRARDDGGQDGHKVGLRAVAVFELSKGLIALLVLIGLSWLIHRGAEPVVEAATRALHLNADHRVPILLLRAARRLDSLHLGLLVVGAGAYVSLRLIEAYGLWREREWGRWLGVISGGVYLPLELYELRHPTAFKVGLLVLNVAVVGYLIAVGPMGRPRRVGDDRPLFGLR